MIELEVNNGIKICIEEPNELLELMSGEDKVQLISSLSCHDEVITHVMDQVCSLHGCTEEGDSGWSSGVNGSQVIDKARMKIAESASELSEDTIKELKNIIDEKNRQINELYKELDKN